MVDRPERSQSAANLDARMCTYLADLDRAQEALQSVRVGIQQERNRRTHEDPRRRALHQIFEHTTSHDPFLDVIIGRAHETSHQWEHARAAFLRAAEAYETRGSLLRAIRAYLRAASDTQEPLLAIHVHTKMRTVELLCDIGITRKTVEEYLADIHEDLDTLRTLGALETKLMTAFEHCKTRTAQLSNTEQPIIASGFMDGVDVWGVRDVTSIFQALTSAHDQLNAGTLPTTNTTALVIAELLELAHSVSTDSTPHNLFLFCIEHGAATQVRPLIQRLVPPEHDVLRPSMDRTVILSKDALLWNLFLARCDQVIAADDSRSGRHDTARVGAHAALERYELLALGHPDLSYGSLQLAPNLAALREQLGSPAH